MTVQEARTIGISDWEYARLIRSRALENMRSAVSTLQSLSNLVNSLPNMVVLDHIATLVASTLSHLEHAKHSFEQQDFEAATRSARHAIVAAESAFFDPTMVSRLYFPDEHKFAVYMPFFVPVTVPLVSALVALIRNRKSTKPKQD